MSKCCVGRHVLAAVLWLTFLSPMFAMPHRAGVEQSTVSPIANIDIWAPPSPEALWLANIGALGTFHGWRAPVQRQQQAHAQPFGYETSRRLIGGLQDKWQKVKNRLPAERKILADCRADINTCPQAARALIALIDNAMKRDRDTRVAEINRAINLTIRFAEDRDTYGIEEYWATPLMTFARRAGDCEDYAIAKLVALQEMGFEARDLRIVIVRDENGQGHAMTAARQDDRWLILDNRRLGLADDSVTDQSTPLFVIDDDGAKRLMAPQATGQKEEAAPDMTAASALLVWPQAVAAVASSHGGGTDLLCGVVRNMRPLGEASAK